MCCLMSTNVHHSASEHKRTAHTTSYRRRTAWQTVEGLSKVSTDIPFMSLWLHCNFKRITSKTASILPLHWRRQCCVRHLKSFRKDKPLPQPFPKDSKSWELCVKVDDDLFMSRAIDSIHFFWWDHAHSHWPWTICHPWNRRWISGSWRGWETRTVCVSW